MCLIKISDFMLSKNLKRQQFSFLDTLDKCRNAMSTVKSDEAVLFNVKFGILMGQIDIRDM